MKLAMTCKAMTPRPSVAQVPRRQQAFSAAPIRRQQRLQPCRALEIDWSDPDTQIAALGAVVGLVLGIGVPAFYGKARHKCRLAPLNCLLCARPGLGQLSRTHMPHMCPRSSATRGSTSVCPPTDIHITSACA